MTKIVKRYISQEQINRYCLNIVSMMWADDFKPDIVVGITRGGLLPAIMISHYLGIKMHTFDVRLRDAKIKENALRIHNALGCRHYSRVDFILCEETGNPYMLEVNTLPGMSKTSLLPMSAASKGINFKSLVKEIIKLAIDN